MWVIMSKTKGRLGAKRELCAASYNCWYKCYAQLSM